MSDVYKFEREIMLYGENIHVNKKHGDTSYKKHWHNYYELIVYNGCEGVCNLNGMEYEITPSCLFFLTPKDFHEIITANKPGSSSVVVSFTENAVDENIMDKLTENPIVLYDVDTTLMQKADELYTVFAGGSRYRRQHLEHLLNCILIEIVQKGTAVGESRGGLNPVVRRAISYILTNPSGDLTLEAMARRVGLSGAYFSTIFKSSTGIAYKKYVTTIRIEHARRLLEAGELSALEVGLECGFNTPSQFIRMFKAMVGDTPSGYRMKNSKS